MEIVVGGAGKLGSSLVHELYLEGHNVTVIDVDPLTLDRIILKDDVQTIEGSITSIDLQKFAEVQSADIYISATDSDEVNMTGAIIAKRLGAKHTLARVRDTEYASHTGFVRDQLGISYLINPELESARHLAEMLQFPAIFALERFISGDIIMMEGQLRPDSNIVGLDLKSFRKLYPSLIITAVVREGEIYIPGGDFKLGIEDRIQVTGSSEDLRQLYTQFANFNTKFNNILIIGGGRISEYLLSLIQQSNFKITLIEKDEDRAMDLAAEFPKVRVIKGDGTDYSILEELHMEDFDFVLALTGMDEQNVMLGLYAQAHNVPRSAIKVNRTGMLHLLTSLDLQTVITPHSIAAENAMRYIRARNSAINYSMDAHYKLMNNQVHAFEYKLLKSNNLLGTRIMDLKFKEDTLIAFIFRTGKVIFPSGADMLQKGDRIALITKETDYTDLEDFIQN